MIIVSPTERYERFDLSSLMVNEGSLIKKHAGLRDRNALWQAMANDDPDGWRVIIWILRRRNGQPDLKYEDSTFAWYLDEDGVPWPRDEVDPDETAPESGEPEDPEVARARELAAEYDEATRQEIEFPDAFPTDANPAT